MHGDATDSGVGNNLITAMVNFTSCSYCGLAYDYFDKCASNGNESHIIDLILSWPAEDGAQLARRLFDSIYPRRLYQ